MSSKEIKTAESIHKELEALKRIEYVLQTANLEIDVSDLQGRAKSINTANHSSKWLATVLLPIVRLPHRFFKRGKIDSLKEDVELLEKALDQSIQNIDTLATRTQTALTKAA